MLHFRAFKDVVVSVIALKNQPKRCWLHLMSSRAAWEACDNDSAGYQAAYIGYIVCVAAGFFVIATVTKGILGLQVLPITSL